MFGKTGKPMAKRGEKRAQIAPRNEKTPGRALVKATRWDSLSAWLEFYLTHEVTTLESSRKVQRRDLELFLSFMQKEVRSDECAKWTPRLSTAFKTALRNVLNEDGSRKWNDRTVNRILAHLKTFAKFVNKHRPFPLGDPATKLKSVPTASLLEIERALTPTERRQILDAADLLLETGGRSRDRKRFAGADKRPRRKGYRSYRNRAIVYTLIETGMRRAAVTKLKIDDIDFENRKVRVEEKGAVEGTIKISREGTTAVKDYLDNERDIDAEYIDSPYFFLPAHSTQSTNGKLSVDAINDIWNQVCETAGVKGKTPHSARHAMGRHLMDKLQNIAAVQRQLLHKNAAYSVQYSRVTDEELGEAIDERK